MAVNLSARQLIRPQLAWQRRACARSASTRARPARARNHREPAHAEHARYDDAARGVERDRRAAGARRFRHEILVAVISQTPAGARTQGGSVVRARRSAQYARRGDRHSRSSCWPTTSVSRWLPKAWKRANSSSSCAIAVATRCRVFCSEHRSLPKSRARAPTCPLI